MHDAAELLAGLVLEDGRAWGTAATDWQHADANAILAPGDPRWHYLTRPRGASKTTDLAGVAIAALLEQLPRGARAYALAADRDQGALLVDAISGFVDRTEGLAGALQVDAYRVAATRTGATLTILAADEASSWGLKPEFVIVDDFAYWSETTSSRRLWRSIFSSLAKRPTSRLVILTAPGDPAHFAHGVLTRAKQRPTRWRIGTTRGPVPWIDPADLEEQRAELPEWEYERLHLGIWRASEDRLTTVEDLRACVRLDGPQEHAPTRTYAIGVDVGLKHDRTVVAVASTDGQGSVGLDRMGVWQGTRTAPVSLDAVETWILETWDAYGRPPVVADPYQAAQLLQRLARRGVHATEYPFTHQSVSRLALRLHNLISDHALVLPDDAELLDELAHVRLRESSPGVYRLDHDPSRHDDRAIALALAAEALLADGTGPVVRVLSRERAIQRATGGAPGRISPGGSPRVLLGPRHRH